MQALLLVWSALWRVQVSHIAAFVLLPAGAALARFSLGLVLLPMLLVGFGNRAHEGAAEVSHLSSPSCWVALAPCAFADLALLSVSRSLRSGQADPSLEPEREPFLPVPTEFTIRHGWFLLWVLWFILFLVRRQRSSAA